MKKSLLIILTGLSLTNSAFATSSTIDYALSCFVIGQHCSADINITADAIVSKYQSKELTSEQTIVALKRLIELSDKIKAQEANQKIENK